MCLISKEELLMNMKATHDGVIKPVYSDTAKDDERLVEEAREVDSTEVVRCKDCYWSKPSEERPNVFTCKLIKDDDFWDANDFCSYGWSISIDDEEDEID